MNKYIEYAKNNFEGEVLEIVLKQIKLFFADVKVLKTSYNIGDKVYLKKGTYLHGVGFGIDSIDYIKNEGFISANFCEISKPNKFYNCVGFWNLQNDCYLSEYINLYGGATVGYTIGRGPGSKKISKLVPLDNLTDELYKLNNDKEVWMWKAEQSKEVRFMPSKVSDKIQLAFILNMENDYAKSLIEADIFSKFMSRDVLKYFIVDAVIDNFISDERDAFTTDRESGIMFGLPNSLIDGILVGREYERNLDVLNKLKSMFNCYICNLDGEVIY